MNHIRILIAEDDKTNQNLYRRALARVADVDATMVEDGEAAISALDASKYDAVLSDLLMPGANGIEVLDHAASKDIRTLVLISTSVRNKADLEAFTSTHKTNGTLPPHTLIVPKEGRLLVSLLERIKKLVRAEIGDAIGQTEERSQDTQATTTGITNPHSD